MLERSKLYPVSVKLGSGRIRGGKASAIEPLLAQIHRVRDLELREPWERYEELASLPDFPGLERLTITGYRYSWTDATFCSGLKHLKISGFSDLASSRSALVSMLDTLDNLQQLESLELDSPLPFIPSLTEGYRVAVLPMLQSLQLYNMGQECSFFLSHIQVPTTASMTILLSDYFDIEDIMFSVASKFNGASSYSDSDDPLRTLTKLSLAVVPWAAIRNRYNDQWLGFGGGSADFKYIETNCWTGPSAHIPNLRLVLPQKIPRHPPSLLTTICRALSGALDDVRTVKLLGCGKEDVLDLLRVKGAADGSLTCLFPSLSTLIVDGAPGPDLEEIRTILSISARLVMV